MNSSYLAADFQAVLESISSELELRPLLTRIVYHACALLQAGRGTIGLVDPLRNVVRTEAACGMPPDEVGAEMGPGVGIIGTVWQQGQPLVMQRSGDLSMPTQSSLLDDSVVGVPIFWHDTIIGVFGIGAAPPHIFTPADVTTLMLFARHAAIAIENARLYAAERRRAACISTIHRLGQLLVRDLAPALLLHKALEIVQADLGLPVLGLWLVDASGLLVFWDAAGDYGAVLAAAGPARLREELQRLLKTTSVWYADWADSQGAGQRLVVPVHLGHERVGLLDVRVPGRLDAGDTAAVQVVADQLGIVVQSARRYEELERRTSRQTLIARLGQHATNHLDLATMTAMSVREIKTQLQDHAVRLILVDDQHLEQVASAGHYPADLCLPEHPEQIPPQLTCQDHAPLVRVLASLRLDTRLVGLLDMLAAHPLAPDDLPTLHIVADQLAVALENTQLFSQLQRTLSETRLLYATSHEISTAPSVDAVIAAYLRQVARHAHYACTIVLYTADSDGQRSGRLICGSWSRHNGLEHLNIQQPYARDALDDVLDSGQTITITDVATDPRAPADLRAMQAAVGRPALALIPLMVGEQRTGLVVLSADRIHGWSTEDLHPYQTTAAQLAAVIDSRQQQQMVLERGQQIALLEERQRLARDLHDSATQLLFSINLIAQTCAAAWQHDPAEGERRINRLIQLSQMALGEMRTMLAELSHGGGSAEGSVAAIRQQGLAAALAELCRLQQPPHMQITLHAAEYVPLILRYEEALYRITQEALANVLKHAGASRVDIELACVDATLLLRVRDDGRGLRAAADGQLHLGLQTMRQRAEQLDGQFTVTHMAASGTAICVLIPLPAAAYAVDRHTSA